MAGNGRIGVCVAIALSGCGPKAARGPSTEGYCSRAYPRGIAAGQSPRLSLSFELSAGVGLEVTQFGHDNLPDYFTQLLNDDAAATGTGFEVANGGGANLILKMFLYDDDTHDHYAMNVYVVGAEDITVGGSQAMTSPVTLFTTNFTLDQSYVTVDQLLADAAASVARFVTAGWTCNEFGAGVAN